MDLIKIAEEAFATGKQHPSFKAGDTITVAYRIVLSKFQVTVKRNVSLYVKCQEQWVLNVSSHWNLRLSTASLSTKLVKFVALNCTTCVHLPVRKPEFRKNVQTCNSVFPEKDKIKGDTRYVKYHLQTGLTKSR